MYRAEKYLFSNFLSTFASLFSTLFLIMSIIFFLQIARITSFVEINLYELTKLYLFMLPRILIFTIPISFFVALAMSLFRLSKENETIVLFTLGYSSEKIARFFLFLAFIVSVSMLLISLFMMPLAENLKDNFVSYKKISANLNIKSSEFGQKFSDWLVFIDDQKETNTGSIYENLILYHPKNKTSDERIILASSGEIANENSNFSLKLKNGKAYTNNEKKWHISYFDELIIRTVQKDKIKENGGILGYWKNEKNASKQLSIYILVSLFPLASIYFAISFGIVTYRYEKGFIYIGIFGVLFCYFAMIMIFAKQPLLAIPLTFFIFLILSYIFYRQKIARRY